METTLTSRRHWLAVCGTVGMAGFAGCGDDDGDDDDGDDTETAPTEPPAADDDDPPLDAGPVSVTVQPSSDVITYGDEYAVDVTVRNGGDETVFFYGSVVARDRSGTWTTLSRDELRQLSPGDERTGTLRPAPPATGDLEFGYMDGSTGVVLTRWNLAVDPLEATFRGTNRFYDGLAVSADIETEAAIDMPVEDGNDRETRPISAPEGRAWARVHVQLENTNDTGTVGFRHIHSPEFFLNANGIQQPQYDGRIGWNDPEFEDQLPQYQTVRIRDMDGFFSPPSEIAAGGVYEGWRLFTAPDDTPLEDVAFVLIRDESSSWDSIRARWTST